MQVERRPIRVMLVEDHNLVRAGIRAVIDGQSDIQVIAEATEGQVIALLAGTSHESGPLQRALVAGATRAVRLGGEDYASVDFHTLGQALAAGIKRIGALTNPDNPASLASWKVIEAAAPPLGLKAESIDVRKPEELEDGLEEAVKSGVDALITQLNQSLGITVVIVTHDVTTLFGICSRIAVLVDKKITVDTLDHLMHSQHPWIREFLHGPRAQGAMTARKWSHGNR